jgi:hypothetical protein
MFPAQPIRRIMASWFTEKRSGSRGTMLRRECGRQWIYFVLRLSLLPTIQIGSGHFCRPLHVPMEHRTYLRFRGWHLFVTHAREWLVLCLVRYCPSAPRRGRASGVHRVRQHSNREHLLVLSWLRDHRFNYTPSVSQSTSSWTAHRQRRNPWTSGRGGDRS